MLSVCAGLPLSSYPHSEAKCRATCITLILWRKDLGRATVEKIHTRGLMTGVGEPHSTHSRL